MSASCHKATFAPAANRGLSGHVPIRRYRTVATVVAVPRARTGYTISDGGFGSKTVDLG